MINNVVPVDRLIRDPNLCTTGSGISVATFTLTINRQHTSNQDERGTDFVSCVVWHKAAENFTNFTSKGSLVGVQDRIQTRTYDDKGDKRVYMTEVIVDNFSLLESRRNHENRQTNGNNFALQGGSVPSTNNFDGSSAPSTNNAPAGRESNKPQDPFVDSGSAIDISDDDFPF